VKKIKAMIVDDHLVVREGLRQLLELDHDIEVVAEAASGLECLKLLETVLPDLIFMDIKMPGISGIDTTRLVMDKFPDVKIVMLTIYDDGKSVSEAIHAGAKGYVLKNADREQLMRIAHRVLEDGAFLGPSVTAILFNQMKKDKTAVEDPENVPLTQRELEVLKGIVAGYTDRGIGESLFISEHTVRSHIQSLYRKLKVSSRSKAVAKALKQKMIIQGE
jgi:two-component system, NarL family, response regulator DegU